MSWPYKSFTKEEVMCKCGCKGLPTTELMDKLQRIRDIYGKPMKVTSGFRCAVHNVKVGGAPKSKHVEGTAVDIACSSAEKYILTKIAIQEGWGGIGIAKTFIHLDIRAPRLGVIWTY